MSVKSRPVFSKYKNNKSTILENAMSTDSGNEDSGESPQDDLRRDEVIGKTSLRTKSSRAFGIALIVIVGLGVVALVSIIGDFSGLSQEGSSALNSAARAEPFFGGLISFLGTLGILLVAGIVFTVVGIVALILMAIFGIGLFSATASDKPKGQRTARKIARVFGITVLSVFGLAFFAISIMMSIGNLGKSERYNYEESKKERERMPDLNDTRDRITDGLRSALESSVIYTGSVIGELGEFGKPRRYGISGEGAQAAVTLYYLKFGKFPTSFDEAGYQINTTTFEHGVQSVTLGERGEIAVEFILSRLGLGDGSPPLNGTLTLVPKMTIPASGTTVYETMHWSCVPDANFSKLAGSGRFLPNKCGNSNDEVYRKQSERY